MRCCSHPHASHRSAPQRARPSYCTSSSSAHLGHSGTADDGTASSRSWGVHVGASTSRRPGGKRRGGRHPFVPWGRTLGCLLAGGLRALPVSGRGRARRGWRRSARSPPRPGAPQCSSARHGAGTLQHGGNHDARRRGPTAAHSGASLQVQGALRRHRSYAEHAKTAVWAAMTTLSGSWLHHLQQSADLR